MAGAIIGNNSRGLDHNAWRGAAYGAGLGYILGSVAENNARANEAARAANVATAATMAAAPAQPAQQPVTIINNYYNTPSSPMTSANGLFGR